jgi:adenosylcobyric acid synthase
MSNNAAVTADGGEIGRAQALQARACGVPPSIDMNPVLLKPQSETGAQLVVAGQAQGTVAAGDYHALKRRLLPGVLASFERLCAMSDLVLVEGAGSPAEINLSAGDIANMGFAEAADVPVVLVGDIERGGVIASLVGTVALLAPAERARLKGFIVNKFRGDPRLFSDGMAIIAARTGIPGLGLVPWFAEASRLPAEDSSALDSRRYAGEVARAERPIKIAVPRLPRIANFDDLDPLAAEPDVMLTLVPPGRPLPADADVVLLAGSKATRADLAAFRAEGWDIDLAAHLRRGGRAIGLCGGFQMLGRTIADPAGLEGPPGTTPGLGYLDVETVLAPEKTLREVRARDARTGSDVRGYEIHLGATSGPDRARPLLVLDDRPEGAVSADGRVEGCYIHGLFASDAWRRAWIDRLRDARGMGPGQGGASFDAEIDRTLDRLADHLAASLDLERILEIARAR